jgi:hypothetical protein
MRTFVLATIFGPPSHSRYFGTGAPHENHQAPRAHETMTTIIIASWNLDIPQTVWSIAGAIVLVCAIGALFLKSRKFIVDAVSEQLKDPSVVKSLALLVKPDLVFDEKGAVLVDRGAWAAIKENGIIITKDTSDSITNGLPITIRIAFNKNLPTAPLLTPIGPDVIFVTSTRGNEFEWVYTLHYSLRSDPDDIPCVRKYRLELI